MSVNRPAAAAAANASTTGNTTSRSEPVSRVHPPRQVPQHGVAADSTATSSSP